MNKFSVAQTFLTMTYVLYSALASPYQYQNVCIRTVPL